MTGARVRPVRKREHNDELGVDVAKVIGYVGERNGKPIGPWRATYREASADLSATADPSGPTIDRVIEMVATPLPEPHA